MQEIRIGDVTISSIVERDGPWRLPEAMFIGAEASVARGHLAEMEPFLYDAATGRIVITYQSFLVRTPRYVIMVDTCTGEDKGYAPPMDFPKQPWMDGFGALGLRVEDIDYVFCTHLHIDHTGWNTRLVNGRWVPTFPKAKYVFHKGEYAFWEQAAARGEDPQGNLSDVWRMNCLPVVEAGQALLVEDCYALDDTVWLTPSPGHTPGHCNVNIRSRGLHAVMIGDLIHHALQCREPGWTTRFCWNPEMTVRSRKRFLEEVADSATLVLPTHFPAPTAGRVEADGARFRFRFQGNN